MSTLKQDLLFCAVWVLSLLSLSFLIVICCHFILCSTRPCAIPQYFTFICNYSVFFLSSQYQMIQNMTYSVYDLIWSRSWQAWQIMFMEIMFVYLWCLVWFGQFDLFSWLSLIDTRHTETTRRHSHSLLLCFGNAACDWSWMETHREKRLFLPRAVLVSQMRLNGAWRFEEGV